jgi:hypothetical protein
MESREAACKYKCRTTNNIILDTTSYVPIFSRGSDIGYSNANHTTADYLPGAFSILDSCTEAASTKSVRTLRDTSKVAGASISVIGYSTEVRIPVFTVREKKVVTATF